MVFIVLFSSDLVPLGSSILNVRLWSPSSSVMRTVSVPSCGIIPLYTDVPESYASIVVSGVERTVNVTYAGLSSIVVAGPPDDCMVCEFAFVIVEDGPSWLFAKYIPLSPVSNAPLEFASSMVGICILYVFPMVPTELMLAVMYMSAEEVTVRFELHSQLEEVALYGQSETSSVSEVLKVESPVLSTQSFMKSVSSGVAVPEFSTVTASSTVWSRRLLSSSSKYRSSPLSHVPLELSSLNVMSDPACVRSLVELASEPRTTVRVTVAQFGSSQWASLRS